MLRVRQPFDLLVHRLHRPVRSAHEHWHERFASESRSLSGIARPRSVEVLSLNERLVRPG
jgi:hypothetical protein